MKTTFTAFAATFLTLSFSALAQTYEADFSAPSKLGRPSHFQVHLELTSEKGSRVNGSIQFLGATCRDPAPIIGSLKATQLNFRVLEDSGLKNCGGWKFRGEITDTKIEGEMLWAREWRPIVFKRTGKP